MATMRQFLDQGRAVADKAVDTTARWANSIRGRAMPGVTATTRGMSAAEAAAFNLPGEATAGTTRAMTGAEAAQFGLKGTTAAPTGVGGALRSVGGSVMRGLPGAARLTVLPSAAAGVVEGGMTDTEQYEKRFGLAPNTTEGVPGLMRDVGVRALGVASDVGNRVFFNQPKEYLYRDGPNGDPAAQPAAAAPTLRTAAQPNPTDQRLAAGTQAAPLAGPPPEIAPGVRKLGPGNYTNVPGDNTGMRGMGVSSLDTSEGLAREQRAVAIQKEMAAITAGQDQAGVLSNGPGMRVVGGSSFFRRADEEPVATSGSPRRVQAAALARERMAVDQANNAANNAATMRGQDMSNSTSRANSQEGNQVTMRGQDMTAGTAVVKARQDQMQSDRQYKLEEVKYGAAQAKTNFEVRQQAQKDLHTEIGTMLPPGPDGKPDTANAARYATGLNAAMSQFKTALEQKAAKGDTKAAKDLDDLEKRGVAALDAKDKRRFVLGMQAADMAERGAGSMFNPTKGSAVADDTPVGAMRREPGLISDTFVTDRGDRIEQRFVEREDPMDVSTGVAGGAATGAAIGGKFFGMRGAAAGGVLGGAAGGAAAWNGMGQRVNRNFEPLTPKEKKEQK